MISPRISWSLWSMLSADPFHRILHVAFLVGSDTAKALSLSTSLFSCQISFHWRSTILILSHEDRQCALLWLQLQVLISPSTPQITGSSHNENVFICHICRRNISQIKWIIRQVAYIFSWVIKCVFMRKMTTRHGRLFASGKAISNRNSFVKFNKSISG